jgi:hypothetical protein
MYITLKSNARLAPLPRECLTRRNTWVPHSEKGAGRKMKENKNHYKIF